MAAMLLLFKVSGGKRNVRQCVVVMQQPVLLLPKFGAKSSHMFTQSNYERQQYAKLSVIF
jgi:hypothetical protein